jgi:hypothetical protein
MIKLCGDRIYISIERINMIKMLYSDIVSPTFPLSTKLWYNITHMWYWDIICMAKCCVFFQQCLPTPASQINQKCYHINNQRQPRQHFDPFFSREEKAHL